MPRSAPESRVYFQCRGFENRYGAANNSTIPDPMKLRALNVQPYTRSPVLGLGTSGGAW
jgi:hypothetical protein